MPRKKRDPVEYAKTAFDSLRASRYRWDKTLTTDVERSISRLFYDQVFSSGADKSGFSTTLKDEWNNQKMTDDHYMAPQSVTKFIMDSEFLLEDFDHFYDCFMMCRKTHHVKKSENELLSKLTKRTKVLTRDRYKHLGFNLYRNGEANYVMKSPELLVPTYFTDWELGYQNNGFRATIVPNESGTLEDFI